MLEDIQKQAVEIVEELCEAAKLEDGGLVVVGCSSSEVQAHNIGSYSNEKVGEVLFQAIYETLCRHNLYLAAQCCEHLNRALIMEKAAMEKYGYNRVNVIPQLKAGGSFGTAAYKGFKDPVAVEFIRAGAGIDIGDTLIGMHLAPVAIPVRTKHNSIGEAHVVCARTRYKFVGGDRAVYNEELL